MSTTIKRTLSLFLCAALLFCIAPLTAVQAVNPTSGTCGDNLTWSYNTSTATLAIRGTGEMYDYDDSSNVTTAPWQPYCSIMRVLVINSGVTSIGRFAFFSCTGLTSVTIGNSVTSIGNFAFFRCTGLTSVTIPDSVTSIGKSAFEDCTGLTSVTIPDSVTSIGERAFYDCTGLTSVTIPDSVTSIGDDAFWECTGLTAITVSEGNPNYSSDSFGVLYNKNKTKLIQYPIGNKRTSFTIPDSVTSIGNGAFLGCTGMTSVTIGNSVTSIGDSAFAGCTGLTSVTIPNSVTSIGSEAFRYCTGLTSVTIPDSVTSIGNYAFLDCTGLANVTIGNSVTSIGDGAFADCTGLTSVTIGNSVTSIGYSAFDNCTGLTSVTIPDSVTSIGNYAFYRCTGLTSATIGNSVMSIGETVFGGCTSLTAITVAASNSNYSSDASGVLYNKSKTELIQYPIGNSRKAFTIPGSVTSIGERAFYDCIGLTSVTIPNSVTNIGKYAFAFCSRMKDITVSDSVRNIGEGAFDSTPYYRDDSKWENNVLYIGNHLIKAKEDLTGAYEIRPGTKTIADTAFRINIRLTCVTIPNSVTSIGNGAFLDCTGMTSVTIGNSVMSIGDSAFAGCTGLTSVIVPNSVTSIGDGAFEDCDGLASVTIPDRVTSIGNHAFACCDGLTMITVATSNLNYSSDASGVLYNKSKTELIQYPIGNSRKAFTIPGSVTSIGDYAFRGCTGLTSVTIPDSVTSIGEDAFYGCKGLTSVTIPNSVTSIDRGVFYGCQGLTSVTIPNSVTSIGASAFSHCDSLTSVTIPNSMTSIDDWAFYECSGLTNIYYRGTESQWNAITIGSNNTALTNVNIHYLGNQPVHTHSYTATVTKQPTCKEAGVKTFTCSACGDSYTEPIAKLAHTPKTVTIPATCQAAGAQYDICEVCGETLSDVTTLPKLDHTYTETITKQPTCKEAGVKTFTCSGCGASYTEPIARLAHTPGEWQTVKEPTETETGKAEKRCTVCGETLEEKELPKLEVVKDETTGIELSFAGEDYNGDVSVKVEQSFDGAAFNLVNTQTGAVQQAVYDITLSVNGAETQPNGKIKVKIPVPAGYDPAKTFVYHVNTATGKLEKMNAVYENGFMVFETDHFSFYAIVEAAPKVTKVELGDVTINYKDSVTLNPTITADPGAQTTVKYESSNEKVAKVDANGKVTGAKRGSATITVTVTDGSGNTVKDTCTVTVKYTVLQWIIIILLFGWIWY